MPLLILLILALTVGLATGLLVWRLPRTVAPADPAVESARKVGETIGRHRALRRALGARFEPAAVTGLALTLALLLGSSLPATGNIVAAVVVGLLAYGVSLVPHSNESCRNNLHLLFSAPERICPLAEWGDKINRNVQWFYRDVYEPRSGYFEPPTGPGFGYELDEAKIERRVEL